MKVYTGGTFDLMHSGHVNFLMQCKKIAGVDGEVIISLNTDEFIFNYKKKHPIMTYYEREALLLGCKFVDKVIPNIGNEDSKQAILSVQPHMVAIGTDWARKDYYKQMMFTQDWLDQHNIMLCYIPYTKNVSTTELKRRIMESQ
jgi:glycerol-3-phosphate cytidylyltransferase